jgi:hypothetical protein
MIEGDCGPGAVELRAMIEGGSVSDGGAGPGKADVFFPLLFPRTDRGERDDEHTSHAGLTPSRMQCRTIERVLRLTCHAWLRVLGVACRTIERVLGVTCHTIERVFRLTCHAWLRVLGVTCRTIERVLGVTCRTRLSVS